MKILATATVICLMPVTAQALLINEVDADMPGTDDMEFIELYDEGIGNTALDDHVVVLFNGSDDASYFAFDLDGYATNAEGYFVIGGSGVAQADLRAPKDNFLQNGADAVALYRGDASLFPNDTPVTTDGLIDALVYDTDDGDDPGLLVLLLAGELQINEGYQSSESNQRYPDGLGGGRNTYTYYQAAPTPGESNGGYPAPVPEPATMLLMGSGLAGLAVVRRHLRR